MMARPMPPSIFPYSEVEQQLVKWDYVMKVKHGDTLRRLEGHVDGKLMDYTMKQLKNKLISLFKFSDDAELILTYTDIDGDIVTLDNDDELRDAVIGQHLNPIRITVQLKSKPDTSSYVASPPSETSSVAHVPNSVFDVQKTVCADMFNVVDKALPNLSASEVLNFKSDVEKATSCSPTLPKLVEQRPQVGLSKSNQTKPFRESTSVKPSVAPANSMNHDIAYVPKWSYFPTQFTIKKIESTTKHNDSAQTVDAPGSLKPLENLHDSFLAAKKATNPTMLFGFPKHTPVVSTNSSYTPSEGDKKITSNEAHNLSYLPINRDLHPPQCPYSQRFFFSNKPNIIREGVQCDGCGTHSIVGPRFMSNTKENHDLCNVCYTKMGNEAEYTRLDCASHGAPTLFQHGYHNEKHCRKELPSALATPRSRKHHSNTAVTATTSFHSNRNLNLPPKNTSADEVDGTKATENTSVHESSPAIPTLATTFGNDIATTPNQESVKYTSANPSIVAEALAEFSNMKFFDGNELNMKMLVRNGGSIKKRAVPKS